MNTCRLLDSRRLRARPNFLRMEDHRVLASFQAWQTTRAFSPATVKRRRGTLRLFAAHIAPLSLADATTDMIEEFLSGKRAPRTRHAYRSDLAAFYGWAVKRKIVATNPVTDSGSIRVPKSLPRPVDPALIPGLIGAARGDTQLMVALAACAGLRRAEIAHLSSDDLSLHTDPPLLVVRDGKGGKDRVVPVHPILLDLLKRRRIDGRLFHLTPDAVYRRMSKHLRACGLDATPHALRHTFGSELARATRGNLVLVGQLMGHADTNTTKGYVGWAGGEGSAAVASMFGGVA